jgi:hypothetical protein
LLEFEFMFEFICLNPFFQKFQIYLPPPSFLFFCFSPLAKSAGDPRILLLSSRATQPCCVAGYLPRPNSAAQPSIRQPTSGPVADPGRLPSTAVARWEHVVITFPGPNPICVRPGARLRATRAPFPWTRSPRMSLAAFKVALSSPP